MMDNSTIEKLAWSEELTLHNTQIDNQHKKIFNIINEVIDTNTLYPKSELFAQILSELSDYGLEHFKCEEALMKKMNYSKLEEHKKDHLRYIYEISMFNLNFRDADHSQPEVVLNFIKNWWFSHILDMDMDFSKFIQVNIGK